MTGIPTSVGGPPTSNRDDIAGALQGATDEQDAPASPELTEVESRIMRLEEALVSRGVLHDSDLQGPPVPAPGGATDPAVDPAAQGAPAPAAPPPA